MKLMPIDVYADKVFRLPNGKRIKLYPHQRKVLKMAFSYDEQGRLPYQTVVYSCPKKSGKTQLAALVVSWFAFVMAELNDEIIICANDFDAASKRVYKAFRQSVELEPMLKDSCETIGKDSITTNRGVEINAIACDYAGIAGALFSLVTYDELWGYRSEASRRLYEELTPIPTGDEIGRKNCIRFISTYAGYYNESELLLDLYNKGLAGECIDEDLNIWVNKDAGIFMYWDHKARMPWHTPEYLEARRNEPGMRHATYLRLFENEWTAGEEGIDITEWDKCVDLAREKDWTREAASRPNKNIHLSVGVDIGLKRDWSAVVSTFRMDDKVFLGPYQVWRPSADKPIDLEEEIEAYILYLQQNWMLGPVHYDPSQFYRSSQTLWKKGVYMQEYTQSPGKLTEMASNLLGLLKFTNIVIYQDDVLRDCALNVSLKEIPGRGFKIDKTNRDKKIDPIVALAMSAVGAISIPSSSDDFKDTLMVLRN